MARSDPLRQFNFRVEIDGQLVAGFQEVNIPDASNARKMRGLRKFTNIVLKRGIWVGSGSLNLLEWVKSVTGGSAQRKHLSIILRNETGADVMRYEVSGALPLKYTSPDLNARGNEVAIEELELANEGVETKN